VPATAAVAAIAADIGLLASIVSCTVLAVICARRGVREATFFLIGFTGLFIGAVIKIVVDDTGGITSGAHFFGIEVGVSFDAVVLSLGLADRMRREIREREQAQALAAEHERNAMTDSLTGVPNRRAFDDRLRSEWNRCGRSVTPIAVAMFDVDRFKPFNDRAGHIAGDECLRLIAQSAQSLLRRADEFFARYGGEEFSVILPGRTLAEAQIVARRVTRAIRELAIQHPDGDIVTMSAGVYACIPEPHTDTELLLSGADAALYRAKQSGGDRVAV
jgi:diguanylate cyclase (GGDEF)-like protein